MNPISSNKNIFILIVDDAPSNITVLGDILRPHYSVRVATSGQQALVLAHAAPHPDLILLDVMMPEMDGYEVLQQLRANPETAQIPIIFVTALDAIYDETQGLALGAADYITKPVRPAIVLARVNCQLELKLARDRLQEQNKWLEAEVSRRMQQNQLIQDASMQALASLAETRDNETGNHILRTQGYVAVLCDELQRQPNYAHMSQHDFDLITKAAPLHDIGKVGIQDHILLKPGKLTEAEWIIMRTHTTLGAQAIERAIKNKGDDSALDFLHVAMLIAHYHHEKWDGSGYPAGLQGEAIPIAARLMALADVFDALINRRCYKEPMNLSAATAIILDGKGKHFDPAVVDAFITRQADFIAIAARFSDHEAISEGA